MVTNPKYMLICKRNKFTQQYKVNLSVLNDQFKYHIIKHIALIEKQQ